MTLCGAVALSCLAVAGPAGADTFHAAPNGSGTTCSPAAPCSLEEALSSLSPTDEAVLAAGNYGSPADPYEGTLFTPPNSILRGPATGPRPTIYSSAFIALNPSTGSTVRNLSLRTAGQSYGLHAFGTEANPIVVDRVDSIATSPNANAGCIVYGVTMTNSLCAAPAGFGIFNHSGSEPATRPLRLRNTTVYGSDGGMSISQNNGNVIPVTAVNSIFEGGTNDDIRTFAVDPGSVTVTASRSNYSSTEADPESSITPPGTGTNQTAAPVFVNSSLGDLREAAGSPTIDAGEPSQFNGTVDLDGNLRVQGAGPDIGAYERVVAPGVAAGPANARGRSATLAGTVTNGAAAGAAAAFEYGTTPAYGSRSDAGRVGLAATPSPVSASLAGLPPAAVIHWRLVAVNAGGVATTPDATFTTAPGRLARLRIAPRRLRPASRGRSVAAARKRESKPRGAVVTYRSPQAATTRFTVKQVLPGFRSRGRCRAARPRGVARPRRCTRVVTRGGFNRRDKLGVNRFRFTGRVKRKALRPGRYRLVAVPRFVGQRAAPRVVSFRVIR